MASFSERFGFEKKQPLQVDRIDPALRNRLWSAFDLMYFGQWSRTPLANEVQDAMLMLWLTFYKEPNDTYPGPQEFMGKMRNSVLNEEPWHRVYSALEAFLKIMGEGRRAPVVTFANRVLAAENSGYRIVGTEFIPVTSPEEIKAVEDAVSVRLVPVRSHVAAAIRFLGVGDKRDYRNSVKESISAVESLCRLVTKKRDFGEAMKMLRRKIRMHPALEKAFTVLYAYTSDDGGVRHALLGKEEVSGSEACFMLVACSAFINYVIASMAEAEQPLDK
jgi:hypothetical protein